MNKDDITQKIGNFIISQLDGFDEFTNDDNLVDMGIVTDDFVYSLIQFLDNEFNVRISKNDELEKIELSIDSIGNFIEQRREGEGETIEKDDLMNIFENDQ